MVVVKTAFPADIAAAHSELHMGSGQVIRYVAPMAMQSDLNEHQQVVAMMQEKRRLFGEMSDDVDKWAGVNAMCQAIDNVVEIEMETELFKGKRVLEVGFSTGLPSVYALEHGAKEVTIVCNNKPALESHIKPTMRRNNVRGSVRYITCDFEDLKTHLFEGAFDIILAPELVNTDEKHFEQVHDLLDLAMAVDGMTLFSGRSHYNTCNGNMKAMLDLIKAKGRFDVVERTPMASANETAPRKVIQLMRKIC